MQFDVLGELRVRRGGAPIRLGGPMAHRLLAALLVDAPGVVYGETLIERLWDAYRPATATKALHVHVSHLRRVLEPGRGGAARSVLQTTGDGYALRIDRTGIDADHFEHLVSHAEELAVASPEQALREIESARALWRGRPWGALGDEPWLRDDVERIKQVRRRADELWADVQLALGRHELIVDTLAAAVHEEPLREHRWEQVMLALYRCGRQAEALRAFQDARRVLTEELGIEPSPTLRELEQAILVQDPSLDAPPRSVPERPRHNLPAALTSLVGRSDEVIATRKLLEASRLVTITGTGGCGKTRLAIAVAEGLVDRHDEGAWFVDLAAAPTADVVATQIASDLGLREGGEHGSAGPMELVRAYFSDRELLLVLDNCEHVAAEVAAVIGSLLASCPRLRVLATSRVVIGVVGETVSALSPLGVPSADATPEETASSPAVQLFLARAADAGWSSDPAPEQLTAVGELCRFLDGVPLAIELAAMRTATMAPSEILERLDSRLSLVASDDRLQDRQRAVRTTIEWSHALLADTDRVAFRRLSVFPAGFTLAGAGAVIAGDQSATDAVVGTIARLVASSLVRPDQSSVATRYRMLESIREYAAEQLHDESDEQDDVRARQLDHFVGLARTVKPDEFFGPCNAETMAALDGEHDNVREALELLLAGRDGERAALLAGAMGTYWAERGHWGEGQRWLNRALELSAASRSVARARALIALAQTTSSFAGIAQRIEALEEAVVICREHDARPQLIAALMNVALARAWRREFPAMRAAADEAKRIAAEREDHWFDTAIAVFESLALVVEGNLTGARAGLVDGATALLELGDESFAARTLMYAGNVSRLLGDLPSARRELKQSLDLARVQDIHGTHVHGMLALAQVAMELGDADAPSLFIDCLAALDLIGDARCTAVCQRSLGSLALDDGRSDEATEWLQRSIDGLAEHDPPALAVALADLATIYRQRGDSSDAARLALGAQALAQEPGMPLTESERGRIATAMNAVPPENGGGSQRLADLEEILEIAHALNAAS